MAGCDKIWTSKYQDYLDLRDWARKNKFTCPNGIVVNFMDFLYDVKEDYFDGEEQAIAYSPNELDYFLIKYCPLQFVQDYLKSVHSEKYIQSVLNGTSYYDRFIPPERGKNKVKMTYCGYKKNKLWGNRKFWVQVSLNDIDLHYNDDCDMWIMQYNEKTDTCELGIWHGNYAYVCHSVKALIRKIRKWKLPKGSIVEAFGIYEGETYKFVVK